ncbi:MAG TPA: cell division protein ZapA [Rhodocyclaceae bacterium]|nr:cell division protein ZapA [Rhodocyclaceae bacterium]
MSADTNFLDVKIMGREYRVACTPEERDGLLAAVALVDGKMREIAQRTRNTVAERVAVMAALNIAHDHLAGGKDGVEIEGDKGVANAGAKRRIIDMETRLSAVLGSQQELSL